MIQWKAAYSTGHLKGTYDGNGNAITRNGYTVGWTSSNLPTSFTTGTESAVYSYGPDRQRWKETYTNSSGVETTYYAGKLFEVANFGGLAHFRHYIYAGNELVAIDDRTTAAETLNYIVSDHQGSYSSIQNSGNPGTNLVAESFTAFGNRRNGDTWSGAPTTADETNINNTTRRGYTGESVIGNSMGLNHLNGRVEDAITGRFLSADPMGINPGNTQSFNRYTYVNNNPLTLVDPSGYAPKSNCQYRSCASEFFYYAMSGGGNWGNAASGDDGSDDLANYDSGSGLTATDSFADSNGNGASGQTLVAGTSSNSGSTASDTAPGGTTSSDAAGNGTTTPSSGAAQSQDSGGQVTVTGQSQDSAQSQQSDEGSTATPVTAQTASSAGNMVQLTQIVVQAARTGYLASVPIDFSLADPNEQLWAVYPGNQIYYLSNNSGKTAGNTGKSKISLPKGLTGFIHTHPSWATVPGPGPGDFGYSFPVYGISPFGTWVIYPGSSNPTWLSRP